MKFDKIDVAGAPTFIGGPATSEDAAEMVAAGARSWLMLHGSLTDCPTAAIESAGLPFKHIPLDVSGAGAAADGGGEDPQN